MKMPRSFVDDFALVTSWLKNTYPDQWPEAVTDALIEEAKEAVRRDPTEAITYYAQAAASIRATGYI